MLIRSFHFLSTLTAYFSSFFRSFYGINWSKNQKANIHISINICNPLDFILLDFHIHKIMILFIFGFYLMWVNFVLVKNNLILTYIKEKKREILANLWPMPYTCYSRRWFQSRPFGTGIQRDTVNPIDPDNYPTLMFYISWQFWYFAAEITQNNHGALVKKLSTKECEKKREKEYKGK